jgi:sugar lactone lactonase YvrE
MGRRLPILLALFLSCFPVVLAQVNYEPYLLTTFAGDAGHGSADGTGSAARFYDPYGVAVDSSGYVYVADTHNQTIRRITPAGVVSALAGLAGTYGSADGAGSAARFLYPQGVAVDNAGNVYVGEYGNGTIRKITPAGVVNTLAGSAGVGGCASADGVGSAARFCLPWGVAVDSAGNVYVADYDNQTIRKITPAGVVSTLAGLPGNGGSADGAGSAARFFYPQGVAVDSAGYVYVADTDNQTIRKITPAGVVSTLAGLAGTSGGADGTGSAARFSYPSGVAVDTAGYLYVADYFNHTIRKITPAGVVSTLAGLAGSPGSNDGTGSAARFNFPESVAVDSAGNVYVADRNNESIRKITPAGVVSTLAGFAGGGYGSADGTGNAARFYYPQGASTDSAGYVYVADTQNETIRQHRWYGERRAL